MSLRQPKRSKGFRQTGALVHGTVRKIGEERGFAVARLLTAWDEIAGPDLAPLCRPLRIGYGRGLGATLTVYTTGPHAPLVEMQKGDLRMRVNACYGYNAISRIAITQTAPEGVSWTRPGPQPAPAPLDPEVIDAAARTAQGVADDGLRKALEKLAQNVYSQARKRPATP